jgi:xanthosine utilization system XapX-like protein
MRVVFLFVASYLGFVFGVSFVLFKVRPADWIAAPLTILWIIGIIVGFYFVAYSIGDWAEEARQKMVIDRAIKKANR